jgi:hypothetical protein
LIKQKTDETKTPSVTFGWRFFLIFESLQRASVSKSLNDPMIQTLNSIIFGPNTNPDGRDSHRDTLGTALSVHAALPHNFHDTHRAAILAGHERS